MDGGKVVEGWKRECEYEEDVQQDHIAHCVDTYVVHITFAPVIV